MHTETRRRTVRLLALLMPVAILATGCSSAMAARLADLPVPPGAVMTEEEHGFTDERGPRASRSYSLPQPIDAACPALVTGLRDAGYRVTEFSETPQDVGDAARWCADSIGETRAQQVAWNRPDVPAHVTALVYGPNGSDARMSIVLTAPRPGAPFPTGSLLRMSDS